MAAIAESVPHSPAASGEAGTPTEQARTSSSQQDETTRHTKLSRTLPPQPVQDQADPQPDAGDNSSQPGLEQHAVAPLGTQTNVPLLPSHTGSPARSFRVQEADKEMVRAGLGTGRGFQSELPDVRPSAGGDHMGVEVDDSLAELKEITCKTHKCIKNRGRPCAGSPAQL